ncbi:hypothetical protein [Flavobacterium sharifuzzamanii]|uniref:hypothetical protein n=1 Tax=Flavobacterium sharifuzzamanii TaxID=2211133 RepID=UPI000DAB83C8|nr:hypothetical protein [Flavobacterium sharifuzzamanii]KAF2082950.1 hypothetical protein DMA14_01125 [Flavobacterium sharifuzzamanii]
MKKNIVLFVLFVLPIVAYLFFASGVNSFTTLPVIIPKVADFGNWNSLNGKKISLDKKITVLGFAGTNILENRGNYFNLNEKIYKRYNGFEDLQFVVLCPTGTEAEAQKIVDALSPFTDVKNWNFVFASKEEIQKFYDGLHLKEKLNENLGTSNVYIIDKERNLRGRKDPKEYKEGYDTFHPSELSNEMLDDFKIILYEYRAALKKNHNATKQL